VFKNGHERVSRVYSTHPSSILSYKGKYIPLNIFIATLYNTNKYIYTRVRSRNERQSFWGIDLIQKETLMREFHFWKACKKIFAIQWQLCLLYNHSQQPVSAAYSACLAVCGMLVSPCITWPIIWNCVKPYLSAYNNQPALNKLQTNQTALLAHTVSSICQMNIYTHGLNTPCNNSMPTCVSLNIIFCIPLSVCLVCSSRLWWSKKSKKNTLHTIIIIIAVKNTFVWLFEDYHARPFFTVPILSS